MAAAVTCLALLLQATSVARGPAGVAGLGVLALTAFVLVALHVRRNPHGFLPRAVLVNARLMLAGAAGLALIAAYIAGLFAVPTILTETHGWTPMRIGVGLLPAAVVGAAVSRLSGLLLARVPRHRLVVGLGAASTVGLLVAAAGAARPVVLIGGFALIVAGFGGGQVPLVDAVPGLVPPRMRGIALGVFNLVFFTGGAVGASAVGGLAGAVGFPGALAALAVLPATVPAVAAWALRPRHPG